MRSHRLRCALLFVLSVLPDGCDEPGAPGTNSDDEALSAKAGGDAAFDIMSLSTRSSDLRRRLEVIGHVSLFG